ncbi:hypothetical protein A2526_03405 [candidate division WOR-1 bacterium RIFOXYD2_FULL_36_8]|nr:MAG: hypothetical protein A2526_03405 [candidate division WOR-1 bacterium RIFOXYD2_FULL_36_8]
MNSIDIYFGLFGIVFLVLGLRGGILSAVLSIISLYFSLTIASNFASDVTELLSKVGLLNNELSKIIIILTIFIILTVIFEFIFWILKKIITVIILGPFDKIGGAILGFLRGLIVGYIFLMIVGVFPPLKHYEKEIKSSRLSELTNYIMNITLPHAETITKKITESISIQMPEIKKEIKIPYIKEIKDVTSKTSKNTNKIKRVTP